MTLPALAVTLLFGVLKFPNFAVGAMMTVAAYMAFAVARTTLEAAEGLSTLRRMRLLGAEVVARTDLAPARHAGPGLDRGRQ